MTDLIKDEHLWSIILAGGEGERLRQLTKSWLGYHKPKQYCTFIGTRSMFQHTVDRASLLSSPERTLTVIAKAHCEEAMRQLEGRQVGELVVQPENRDTAAGIFLPLTHVRARDPRATVVIYPSDHFVHPETRFVNFLEAAARAVDLLPGHLVLVTVSADRIEPEYGWIRPGLRLGCIGEHNLHKVEMFVEKPDAEAGRQILLNRGLWNTLIMAAKVEDLWKLGWEAVPEMMELFEEYADWIGTPEGERARVAIYGKMPRRNISSHLLARVSSCIAALQMTGVLWSDWGKAERITSTLRQIGKYPAFSTEVPETVSQAEINDDCQS